MPRRYNDKLHPRKINGQFAKKGTGVLLSPKSGRSRSYASRAKSGATTGKAQNLASITNKAGGSRTKSSNRKTNALIAGAVVGTIAAAGVAYGAHHYVTTVAKGGPTPLKANLPSFSKVGNIKLNGRIRIQHPKTGRFQVQKSAFPRSR